MALDHAKMRRILDKYWRVPGRSLTSQWDGDNSTLQAYFDAQGVDNVTASAVIAKESDYDTWLTSVRALQKTYADRRQAYGEWGDQLDEIFHDIDAWRSRISAVKAAHPKPE
jgi:ribulose 1,5-bisphosphate carboxylase large subunit-like protein